VLLNGWIIAETWLTACIASGSLKVSISVPKPPRREITLGRSPQHDPQNKPNKKQGHVHEIQERSRAEHSPTFCPDSFRTPMSRKYIAVSICGPWQQQMQRLGPCSRAINRVSVSTIKCFGPQHCEQPSSHWYCCNIFSPLKGAKVFSKW
jgi:hypothetical protein